MVVIRLSRRGRKDRPFYHINVADQRFPRDGRFIERIGFYNPLIKEATPDSFHLDAERYQYWIERGAQPSDTVRSLRKRVAS